MKNTVLLILAACTLLSCLKESNPVAAPDDGILYATISADEAATKSILLDNPGTKMDNRWTGGDRIGIFGSGTSNLQFTINAASISTDGKKAAFNSDSSIPKGELSAYSPYQAGAALAGGEITIDFPKVQQDNGSAGISAPDPAANIMLGSGSGSAGLSFSPVMAMLKFGLAFEEDVNIARVEFRDLSGAPVAGSLKLTGTQEAAVTGSEKVLTLETGAQGTDIPAGFVHPFFLIVPAREYSKGFEITFITSGGSRVVKRVGTVMGKTLSRGVVYPIGDVAPYEYATGAKTELMPGARIVTPEMADLIHVISIGSDYIADVDGQAIKYAEGGTVFRPTLDLLVSDSLGLQEGNWLIFEYGSAQVPDGGVFKIETVYPLGGGFSRIFARTEANIAAPFKEVKIGREMFDAADNEIEGAGVDLDVASYVRQVLDEDGNPVPFSVSPDGELLFSEEATAQLTGIRTKASVKTNSVTLPEASMSFSEDHFEASLGAVMSIDFRTAVGFFDGEAQYIYYTAHPTLTLKASFTAKGEMTKDAKKRFFKLDFAPIPAAPGVVLIPSLEFWGTIGVTTNIKFTTSATFTHDMGTYGVSYNKGDGFTVRHKSKDPGQQEEIRPSVDGFSGYLGAWAGLSLRPYLSLYGMFGLGLDLDCNLNFGLSITEDDLSSKLSLYPSLQITPRVITLGGYYTKTIKKFSGTISFDPLWERYITPAVTRADASVPGHLSEKYYKFKMGEGYLVSPVTVPDGVLNYRFTVKGQVLSPMNIGLRILRGRHDDVSFVSVNSGISDFPFSYYLAAGIPTLSTDYIHVLMQNGWFGVEQEKLEIVGTYDVLDGGGEQTFEGHIPFTPQSAQPYWYAICYVDDAGVIMRNKATTSIYSPDIWLWPTDWWGQNYVPE